MHKLFFLFVVASFLVSPCAFATTGDQNKAQGGPPPMLVSVKEVSTGQAIPVANFVGSIFFSRTAQVAAEVEGLVLNVFIEEGESVSSGQRLVQLDDKLMVPEISGTRAAFEQNNVDLEQAERDFKRVRILHEQESIATTEFESYSNRVSRLTKQAIILKARLERLLLEQEKKTVRAPFSGVIVESLVDEGEWVSSGGVVAVLADNSSYEAHVDIPANITKHLSPGDKVLIKVDEQELSGSFLTVVPRGDISTRTFVAKFTLETSASLYEGMQTEVSLPISEPRQSLLVPRDAIINSLTGNSVFVIEEGLARQIPIDVTGYLGEQVGVQGEGLKAGQPVIVKGNERIRDGQPVRTE